MALLRYFTIICLFLSDNIYIVYTTPTFHAEDPKQVQDLKKSMLELFGLKHQPRPEFFDFARDVSSARDYMFKLYKYTLGESVDSINETLLSRINDSEHSNESNDIVADTVVSFVNNAYIPRPNTTDEDGSMYFDISSNFVIEKTLKSKLRIYLDAESKTSYDTFFKVTIYQIIIPQRKYLPLVSRLINSSESAWHEFDVLQATKLWKLDPVTNNGILITCESITNHKKSLQECGFIGINGKELFRPFLISFYQSGDADEFLAEQLPEKNDSKYERFRRSLKDLFPRASSNSFPYPNYQQIANTSCERHPLYIGFKDLRWSDWIIAPEGYKASYCRGECTFPLHSNMNATNHAMIQTLVHLLTPEDIPEPCCAPIRLGPLQVLFLDEKNNVVMKKYANMKVIDCGCQ